MVFTSILYSTLSNFWVGKDYLTPAALPRENSAINGKLRSIEIVECRAMGGAIL